MKELTDGCRKKSLDLGLCGTEEVYFSTFHYQLDGGIMVTASHNPGNYNGMKLVRRESRPLSGDFDRRLADLQKVIDAVESISPTGFPLTTQPKIF